MQGLGRHFVSQGALSNKSCAHGITVVQCVNAAVVVVLKSHARSRSPFCISRCAE